MKNLFKFVCILALFIVSHANAQNYVNKNAKELLVSTQESNSERKRLLYCVTTSCCGIGSFGIEVWSHKECTYLVTGKKVSVVSLKNSDGSDYKDNEIEIKNDITLFDKDNSLEEEGLEAVMKAGLYQVIDGQIAFEPSVQRVRIKKACVVSHHQGTFLGHSYDYTLSTCVYYPVWESHQVRSIQGGYAVIDIRQDEKLLQLANENENTLVFDENIILDNKYIIKAGRYSVDEGKIYTRNIQLK
ncbi:hypothetical protein AR438_02395 [Chryseobacterium aquaticum]|uniref:Uncharacterized protein n=1 Tax=Chryseobacterium aquaticum TaxID=452084 RepID=A0A0Q3HW66_9FLAO|nr:hypothetical protein [Chryseobacterium aquaticum]KQK27080.1 hypothetical protein AR438_02395 [Chryseobacterium aquaticum]